MSLKTFEEFSSGLNEEKMTKELTVVDDFAYSDKYPNKGFAIDFKDAEGIEYFADYPKYSAMPFEFEKGKKYKLSFSAKQQNDLSTSLSKKKVYKISRLTNIHPLNEDDEHIEVKDLKYGKEYSYTGDGTEPVGVRYNGLSNRGYEFIYLEKEGDFILTKDQVTDYIEHKGDEQTNVIQ